MTTYSVADAKAGLPRLIDKAMAGEEVIITRHGKPVAELRPTAGKAPEATATSYQQLIAGRITPKGKAPNSVELLNMIYDDPLS
jgi:prevent-host-death family protein